MKIRLTLLILFLGLVFPKPAFAYYSGMPASVVLGKTDFNTSTPGTSASLMADPLGLNSDGTHLFVADTGNQRVLIWNRIPTESGTPADVVLGQPDFSSSTANNGGISAQTLSGPYHIATDGTHLAVADSGNRRVLIWNTIPTRNQQPADVVVGQPDFATSSTGQTASKISTATGVAIYNGKLFLSDNRRVLIWNSIPTTNGVAADVVVGQDTFTAFVSQTAVNRFAGVRAIAAYDNKLFAADSSSNRVLIFDPIPTTNGASASVVIGQPSFTTSTVNNGGLCGGGMNFPDGISILGNGRLLIAEGNRDLIFNQIPTTNQAIPDIVIGQADCSGAINGGTSDSVLWGNERGGVEVNNKLILADQLNRRVLIFNNVLSGPQLSMNTPESITDGKLKVAGNVLLGERSRYALQRMQANVNGQGFSNVTSLGGGTDDGTDKTRYEFSHEFEPWAGISAKDQYNISTGYTLNLKASSYNAEEDNIFYFQPFGIKSIVGNQINLNINKDHWDRIKNNLDSFEIQQKKNNVWTTIQEKVELNSEIITTTKTLSGEIRLVAKDKWGHRQNVTNSVNTGSTLSSYNLNTQQVTPNFPLQINRISGFNTGVISTYQSISKTSFVGGSTRPTFSGIAYAGSTVTVLVTDPVIGRSQVFVTTTKSDSSWQVIPTLYNTSVIDAWVTDSANRYTELPTIKLSILRSEQ